MRPWHWPEGVYRSVKYAVQRARRGYSDRDVWSLDHYLARVLAGGLRRLADTTHGHPAEYAEGKCPGDVPSGEVVETFTFEDWRAELRHAADLFQEIVDGDYGLDVAVTPYEERGQRVPIEVYRLIWEREEAVNKEAMAWLSKRWRALCD
jgi:hypothetical protein